MHTPGGVRKRGARRGGGRQMGLLDALSGFLLGPVRALARRGALAEEPMGAGLRLPRSNRIAQHCLVGRPWS